jgi:hypothetical protein
VETEPRLMLNVNRSSCQWLKAENIYTSILPVIHEGEFVFVFVTHHKDDPNASVTNFLAFTEDDHDLGIKHQQYQDQGMRYTGLL